MPGLRHRLHVTTWGGVRHVPEKIDYKHNIRWSQIICIDDIF
jgi:hypothetical protein